MILWLVLKKNTQGRWELDERTKNNQDEGKARRIAERLQKLMGNENIKVVHWTD